MGNGWYSVEQVADLLDLHVRTVRGYIRDGKLKAVRIGKQYRIAREDLDAFTGRAAEPARPRAEVSAVIELDGVGRAAADRLSTLILAGVKFQERTTPLHLQTVYDDARSRLKVITVGGVAPTAEILQTIDDILGMEDGMAMTGVDDVEETRG